MTPLHSIGDFIRNLLLAIPLPAVRLIFVGLLTLLLVWVLCLPKNQTSESNSSRTSDLKLWASIALVIQILIYAVV